MSYRQGTRRRLQAGAVGRALMVAAAGAFLSSPEAASADRVREDARLAAVAREARQVIAVIDWFYVQHRACPQPARPDEIATLQADLGDGYSATPQGQFVEIRGIAMPSGWLYYASVGHPDRCTLWRKLGWDPALIWRREGGTARWAYDPGDGRPERPLSLAP